MKKINIRFLVALTAITLLNSCTTASEQTEAIKELQFEQSYTPEYRIWLGFKKKSLSQNRFLTKLAKDFLPATKARSSNGLISFSMGFSRKVTPQLPDTISLSSYVSKRVLLEASREPSAKKYTRQRWEIYDRSKTTSITPINLKKHPTTHLSTNTAYDILGTPVDWKTGTSTFTIEKTKGRSITKLVMNEIKKPGLHGYIIYLTNSHLISFKNWRNHRDGAKKRKNGDGGEPLIHSSIVRFKGQLTEGTAINLGIKTK